MKTVTHCVVVAEEQILLPDLISGFLNIENSDVGGGELSYPSTGQNSERLTHGREIIVRIDGEEPDNGRWVLEEQKDDSGTAESESTASMTWNGRTLAGMLEKVLVFPMNWPNSTPDYHGFQHSSPGTVIQTLFTFARERGARWANNILTDTFSVTLDSTGALWNETDIAIEFPAGQTNLLQVLQLLKEKNYIDFFTRGRQLHVTNPEASSRDWTLSSWVTQWWKRTELSFNTDPSGTATREALATATIDYTNKTIDGTSNYLQARAETNIFLAGGSYIFSITHRDGLRLTIDGRRIINTWTPEASTRTTSVSTPLPGGFHKVVIEHFTTTGGQRLLAQMSGGELGPTLQPLRPTPIGVALRRGEDSLDAPISSSSRDKYNAVLVGGDEGSFAEATTAPESEEDGRLEAYVSQAGAKDEGTLAGVGTLKLQTGKVTRRQVSTKIHVPQSSPTPGTAYRTGDYVWLDVGSRAERLKIYQINLLFEGSDLQAALTLNDKFYDLDVLVKKRLDFIADGVGGTGPPPSPTPDPSATDTTPPKPPTNLDSSSKSYNTRLGGAQASISMTWDPPTESEGLDPLGNPLPLDDLAGYVIQYSLNKIPDGETTAEWSDWYPGGTADSGAVEHSLSPVDPGIPYRVRVAAFDANNNWSSWTDPDEGTTAEDTSPPPEPSDPSARAGLSTVWVLWDGLDVANNPPPNDYDHTNFYGTTVLSGASFPSDYALLGLLPGAGEFPHQPNDFTPRRYVTTMVDHAQLEGPPSVQTAAINPRKVISQDVEDAAIEAAAIAEGAITAAKTAVAAIDPATGNLAANTVTAINVQADTIASRHVAARQITGFQLTVDGMSDNLIPNGSFTDEPTSGLEPPYWTVSTYAGARSYQFVEISDMAYGTDPRRSTPEAALNKWSGSTNSANLSSWHALNGGNLLRAIHQDWQDAIGNINAQTYVTNITRSVVATDAVAGSQVLQCVTAAANADLGLAPTNTTAEHTLPNNVPYYLDMWILTTVATTATVEVRWKPTGSASVLLGTITVPAVASTWSLLRANFNTPSTNLTGHFVIRFVQTGRTFQIDGLRVYPADPNTFPNAPLPNGTARRLMGRFLTAGVTGGLQIGLDTADETVLSAVGAWPGAWQVPTTPSAYVWSSSGGSGFRLRAEWFNGGSLVGSTDQALTLTANAWLRASVTSTPPSNATRLVLKFERSTASSVLNEILQFGEPNVTAGTELHPWRNDTLETSTLGAKTSDATLERSATAAQSGAHSGKLSIPTKHGAQITSKPLLLSQDMHGTEAWMREPVPTPGATPSEFAVFYQTSTATDPALGPWTDQAATSMGGGLSAFSRIQKEFTPPAGAKWARLVVDVLPELGRYSARTVYFDEITVKKSTGGAFIRNASIVNAKIVDLVVNKVTGGTFLGDYFIGGSFKTALAGSRTEQDLLGFRLFNAINVNTFNADTSTGQITIKTADFGARQEIGSFGLRLYNASGFNTVVLDTATGMFSLKTAGSGTRLEEDGSGIRLYNGSTLMVDFNAGTGDALVTGTYRSGLSGERIEQYPDGTARYYQPVGPNFSQISNDGQLGLCFRGPAPNNSTDVGYLYIAGDNCTIAWGNQNQPLGGVTRVRADGAGIQMFGRLVGFRQLNSLDSTGTIFLATQNSSFVDIAASVLNHVYKNGAAVWAAPAQDVGLVFGGSQLYVGDGGGTAGVARAIVASAFTPASARARKTAETSVATGLGRLARDVVRGARIKQYKLLDEVSTRPERPGFKVREEIRNTQGKFLGENWKEAEWAVPKPKATVHTGPMADDLWAIHPSLVANPDDLPENRRIDLLTIASMAWEASAEGHDRQDEADSRLDALEAKIALLSRK